MVDLEHRPEKHHSKVNLRQEYSPSYPGTAKLLAKNPCPSMKICPQDAPRSQGGDSQAPDTSSPPNKTHHSEKRSARLDLKQGGISTPSA